MGPPSWKARARGSVSGANEQARVCFTTTQKCPWALSMFPHT